MVRPSARAGTAQGLHARVVLRVAFASYGAKAAGGPMAARLPDEPCQACAGQAQVRDRPDWNRIGVQLICLLELSSVPLTSTSSPRHASALSHLRSSWEGMKNSLHVVERFRGWTLVAARSAFAVSMGETACDSHGSSTRQPVMTAARVGVARSWRGYRHQAATEPRRPAPAAGTRVRLASVRSGCTGR